MDKYLVDFFSKDINIQTFYKYINCIKKIFFIYYRYNLLPFFLFRILLNKKSLTMIFWTEYFRSPACRLPLRWIYDFYSKTHLKLESSRMCSQLCRHINNSCDYPRKQDTTINHIRMQKIESSWNLSSSTERDPHERFYSTLYSHISLWTNCASTLIRIYILHIVSYLF